MFIQVAQVVGGSTSQSTSDTLGLSATSTENVPNTSPTAASSALGS